MLNQNENLKMVKDWIEKIKSADGESKKAETELIEYITYLQEIENNYSYLKNDIKLLNRKVDNIYW